ncbi:MAG: TolC family protein [Bacteroides sp.]
MKINRLFYVTTFALLFLSTQSHAQDEVKPLSLEQAIDSAILHNESLKQAKFTALAAKAHSREANAVFLPQVELSYNAYFTNNPLNAFGFKLQEQSVTPVDFDPQKLNQPGFNKDFSAQIEVVQPIFNLDAIFQRSSAQHYAKMQEWSQKRREEYLRFQVKKAYLEIGLAYRTVDVMEKALTTANAFVERAESMFNQGLIQKADWLEAQVYQNQIRTELKHATSQVANSSDQLSFLMGTTPGVVYRVDNLIPTEGVIPSLNLYTRTDLLAYRSGLSAATNKLKADKMSLIPRINAFGNYQFNDSKPFRFTADSYFAGIRLSWRIFSGTKDWQKIKASKFEQQQLISKINEVQSEAEVDYQKTLRQWTDLNYERQLSESMVQQAEEALVIQSDRYQQGLTTTADYLRIQTQLSKARLNNEVVTFKKNLTIAYLQLMTSTNE